MSFECNFAFDVRISFPYVQYSRFLPPGAVSVAALAPSHNQEWNGCNTVVMGDALLLFNILEVRVSFYRHFCSRCHPVDGQALVKPAQQVEPRPSSCNT